jgi:hypothetical protein
MGYAKPVGSRVGADMCLWGDTLRGTIRYPKGRTNGHRRPSDTGIHTPTLRPRSRTHGGTGGDHYQDDTTHSETEVCP